MSTLLKDYYSKQFYKQLSGVCEQVLPGFDSKKFVKMIYDKDFDSKELKQRMRHTSLVLHEFMPKDFKSAARQLEKIIKMTRKTTMNEGGLADMFFPDYIEVFGIDDFQTSVKLMEFVTQFVSCEFAVRPFLLKYEKPMLEQMLAWSKHKDYRVRRFASEGSRPRLPWGLSVPSLKKDPSEVLKILENLKADDSEWVRRSVANNLNDIAKDHPDLVLKIVAKWSGKSAETDAILKHGSRTLLKQGHTEILKHYGLDSTDISVQKFKILTPEVRIGESLEFSFELTNESAETRVIRLEYAIYYRMKNGQPSKKVFKISEKKYTGHAHTLIHRKQKFILITTRTFYAGKHRLGVIVNGEEKAGKDFNVLL